MGSDLGDVIVGAVDATVTGSDATQTLDVDTQVGIGPILDGDP
jgi:hypothetical protein